MNLINKAFSKRFGVYYNYSIIGYTAYVLNALYHILIDSYSLTPNYICSRAIINIGDDFQQLNAHIHNTLPKIACYLWCDWYSRTLTLLLPQYLLNEMVSRHRDRTPNSCTKHNFPTKIKYKFNYNHTPMLERRTKTLRQNYHYIFVYIKKYYAINNHYRTY